MLCFDSFIDAASEEINKYDFKADVSTKRTMSGAMKMQAKQLYFMSAMRNIEKYSQDAVNKLFNELSK